ncbi:hypothetical protein ACFRAQ_10195 [Nocardia sp. NPDC056611]
MIAARGDCDPGHGSGMERGTAVTVAEYGSIAPVAVHGRVAAMH